MVRGGRAEAPPLSDVSFRLDQKTAKFKVATRSNSGLIPFGIQPTRGQNDSGSVAWSYERACVSKNNCPEYDFLLQTLHSMSK